MRITKLSIISLFAITLSFVNAKLDDNKVPRPGDDRLPNVPNVPNVHTFPVNNNNNNTVVDDKGNHKVFDDKPNTSTSTSTQTPTHTSTTKSTSINNSFKNSINALSLASVFAYFFI